MLVAPPECLHLVLAFTKCVFTSQRSQLEPSGYNYIVIPVVTMIKYVQFVHQEILSKLYCLKN